MPPRDFTLRFPPFLSELSSAGDTPQHLYALSKGCKPSQTDSLQTDILKLGRTQFLQAVLEMAEHLYEDIEVRFNQDQI